MKKNYFNRGKNEEKNEELLSENDKLDVAADDEVDANDEEMAYEGEDIGEGATVNVGANGDYRAVTIGYKHGFTHVWRKNNIITNVELPGWKWLA